MQKNSSRPGKKRHGRGTGLSEAARGRERKEENSKARQLDKEHPEERSRYSSARILETKKVCGESPGFLMKCRKGDHYTMVSILPHRNTSYGVRFFLEDHFLGGGGKVSEKNIMRIRIRAGVTFVRKGDQEIRYQKYES